MISKVSRMILQSVHTSRKTIKLNDKLYSSRRGIRRGVDTTKRSVGRLLAVW